MYRLVVLLLAGAMLAVIALGCAGGGNPASGPVRPDAAAPLTGAVSGSHEQTHLWGYWDVYMDPATREIAAVPNRQAMFTANVTNFINGSSTAMKFKINGSGPQADYVFVDIDVSLTHPFPGMPQYNGYDVRGVFMGDGSGVMAYNPDLKYSVAGTDQYMFPNPDNGLGGPDGYTRWFNKTEFSTGGAPMFLYTQGKLASPGFDGTATLCPYKYFTDGLGATDDLWTWLTSHGAKHGVFSSGATNTRNYYLRFPNAKGVKYGYAVIANWEGTEPQYHPSNAIEAVGCKLVDNSNMYYIDPATKGGNLTLDISIFDWASQLSVGTMENYKLYIESGVLPSVHQLTPSEMTPIGGDWFYSTYHVDIPASPNYGGLDHNNWIIVEYPGHDYTNPFGVTNLAGTDPLAAFFRFDTTIASTLSVICNLAVVTPMPAEGWDAGIPVEFDASGSTGSGTLTFAWDFDGDGVFDEATDDAIYSGTPDKPTHLYKANFTGKASVKVTDDIGGVAICSVDVNVIAHPSKNIQLRAGVQANDIALDHVNADMYVLYNDKSIWKYPRSAWYQSGSQFATLYAPGGQGTSIDMSPDEYTVVTASLFTAPMAEIFDPSGVMATGQQYGGANYPQPDAVAMTAGSNKNDLGVVLGWPAQPPTYPLPTTFLILWPEGNWTGHLWYGYDATVYTGYDVIYYPYIKGAESDNTGNFVWYLEGDPDYYASRWTPDVWPYQHYNNAYFGIGTATDSDDGWYSGLDITHDNLNRFFVLDQLSTSVPRIKMWTVSGDTTTSKGGFADATSISSTPRKIEGCNFNGDVVVLHGTSTYMVSVFVPFEMPL